MRIRAGELITLVGPSGCGKSTLLRLIAGLLEPTDGDIRIGGENVSGVPPERREIGWMPQSYALFEHLNVAQNIAFGLRMRGTSSSAQRQRVADMLDLCRIIELAERPVGALSGGQCQRVAIARALAVSPRVLLLDEPLAALDPQLRIEVPAGLERLLHESGVTTLFVTHDQGEALALADRVAVLRAGRLEQFGSPESLWHQPTNNFVASFFGHAVVLPSRRINEQQVEILPELDMHLPRTQSPKVALRPTDLTLSSTGTPLEVIAVEYAGEGYQVTGRHKSGVVLHFMSDHRLQLGDITPVTLRSGLTPTVVGASE